MQTGILGGTFDPIHCGHIQIAKAVKKALQLDSMMLLPAGDPPHKSHPTEKQDRFIMTQLACEGEEGLYAADDEIRRDGTTFTVDTLTRFHEAQPDVQWYYLIGEDTLEVLDTWRDFHRVAKLCTFVVAGRGDAAVNNERIRQLTCEYGAKFIPLDVCGPDLSSTDIRKRVAEGLEITGMVPEKVEDYIRKQGLYLCGVPRQAILKKLESVLKPSRFSHTLSVARTARKLSEKVGVDPVRAELAGLLHDCAKSMHKEALISLCEQAGDVDLQEMQSIEVIHAPAGSLLAREEYGVSDPSILSAIRKHTIGDAEMSPMEALIYTADFIEPNRQSFEGLEEARELAEKDIYAAMVKCALLTKEYLQSLGKDVHPKTEMMIKNYSKGSGG